MAIPFDSPALINFQPFPAVPSISSHLQPFIYIFSLLQHFPAIPSVSSHFQFRQYQLYQPLYCDFQPFPAAIQAIFCHSRKLSKQYPQSTPKVILKYPQSTSKVSPKYTQSIWLSTNYASQTSRQTCRMLSFLWDLGGGTLLAMTPCK